MKCNGYGYHSNYDWGADGWLRACDTTCSTCGYYREHIDSSGDGYCDFCNNAIQ